MLYCQALCYYIIEPPYNYSYTCRISVQFSRTQPLVHACIRAPSPDFDPSRKRVTATRTDTYLPAVSKTIAISTVFSVHFTRALHPLTFLQGSDAEHVHLRISSFLPVQNTTGPEDERLINHCEL